MITYLTKSLIEKKDETYYPDEQVIRMLAFLTDNIFVEFGVDFLRQVVGISIRTNCATLHADIFFFSI